MRLLSCRFRYVGGLWFSESSRRLVVANAGGVEPSYEVHDLHADDPPALADKFPPRRWVVGYSDALRCLLDLAPPFPISGWFLYRPGDGEFPVGLSASQKQVVFAQPDWPRQVTRISCTLRGANGEWSDVWAREAAGVYAGPVWWFRDDEWFALLRTQNHEDGRPVHRKVLVVCRASDGDEVATSEVIGHAVTRLTSVGVSLVAGLLVRRPGVVSGLLRVFPEGMVDAGTIDLPQPSPVLSLAADPCGRFLLAAVGPHVVQLDASTWQPARSFDWDIGRVRTVAVSPDGTVAAAGGDNGRVAVWDVE